LWGVRLLIVLSCYAAIQSPLYALFIKFWTDIFAISRSFSKVYLLHGLALVLCLVGRVEAGPKVRRESKWLMVSFGLLLLLSLVEYLVLRARFGLDWERVIFLTTAPVVDMSSTQLQHIHNSKAALAYLAIPFVSPGVLYNYDVGQPYLSHYPRLLIAGHALLYMTFCVQIVRSLRRFSDTGLAVYVPYCMACLVAVKGVVDGGPFDFSLLIAMPFFLAPHLKRVCGIAFRTTLATSIAVLTLFFWSRFHWFPNEYPRQLWMVIHSGCGFGVLWAAGALLERGRIVFANGVVITAMLLLLVGVYGFGWPKAISDLQRRAWQTIPAGEELVTLARGPPGVVPAGIEAETLGELDGLRLYRLRTTEAVPYRLLADMGVQLHFKDTNWVGRDCREGRGYTKYYGVRPLTDVEEPATLGVNAELRPFIESMKLTSLNTTDYQLTLKYKYCRPAPETIMAYVAQAIGFQSAIVWEIGEDAARAR
jgi:hypothetical protein